MSLPTFQQLMLPALAAAYSFPALAPPVGRASALAPAAMPSCPPLPAAAAAGHSGSVGAACRIRHAGGYRATATETFTLHVLNRTQSRCHHRRSTAFAPSAASLPRRGGCASHAVVRACVRACVRVSS